MNAAESEVRPGCWVIVFAPGFRFAGVHYVDADRVIRDAERICLVRDDKLVWQGATAQVAEVLRFDNREKARDFHKRRGRDLQAAAGPPGGSTARVEGSPVLEGVQIRVREGR